MGEYHLSCSAPGESSRHPASFSFLINSLYFMAKITIVLQKTKTNSLLFGPYCNRIERSSVKLKSTFGKTKDL